MKDSILIVDDDQVMLKFWVGSLEKLFDVHIAESAKEGLSILNENANIKVIVSDNQMPDQDGISFLASVKKTHPSITRMLITAFANLENAINSINEGAIFRFLMKPCQISNMIGSIRDGIEQYDLKKAEKDLLENTLTSSISVLTDILGIVSPLAFSRTSRLAQYAVKLATILGIEETWEVEIAARLSQIGCISLPEGLLQSVYSGIKISDQDKETFKNHTEVGSSLIKRIPRLERVSEIIAHQGTDFCDFAEPKNSYEEELFKCAQILRVVFEFERVRAQTGSVDDAMKSLLAKEELYNSDYVYKLRFINVKFEKKRLKEIDLKELTIDMIFAEDVVRKDGFLLIPEGQDVTPYSIEILMNLSKAKEVENKLKVLAE